MIYIFSVACFWLFIDKIYSAKFVLQMFCIVSVLIVDTCSFYSLPIFFFGNDDNSYRDLSHCLAWQWTNGCVFKMQYNLFNSLNSHVTLSVHHHTY